MTSRRQSPAPGHKWQKLVLLFSLFVLLCGCDKYSHKEDPATTRIFAPIRAQVKALNKRDAAGALAEMHPEAPGLDRTRQTTEGVTATYDLLYMIQSLSLEAVNEDEARVRFQQLTEKVSGPEFRSNRVAGIHTLRKYQGAWKIYYTQVLKIEYLDGRDGAGKGVK